MIEFEKVLGAFSLLADIDEATARKNEPLVKLAIAEISVRLKESACVAKNHDRICHACAAAAYYKYTVVAASNENDFTVGDIKFSAKAASNLVLAKQLRDDAIGSIADLLEPTDFAFVQV